MYRVGIYMWHFIIHIETLNLNTVIILHSRQIEFRSILERNHVNFTFLKIVIRHICLTNISCVQAVNK